MEVKLGIVNGDPAHRDLVPGMPAALGEGDLERGCRRHRVLEEQLVEVAHTEEQEHAGVLRPQRLVLRHHRARGGVRHRPAFGPLLAFG